MLHSGLDGTSHRPFWKCFNRKCLVVKYGGIYLVSHFHHVCIARTSNKRFWSKFLYLWKPSSMTEKQPLFSTCDDHYCESTFSKRPSKSGLGERQVGECILGVDTMESVANLFILAALKTWLEFRERTKKDSSIPKPVNNRFFVQDL